MYWIEDISILLYFGLATLYFGEFDVLFQYLFVHDPTNFREEPTFLPFSSRPTQVGRGLKYSDSAFIILLDSCPTQVGRGLKS